jgi:hypothetical protein
MASSQFFDFDAVVSTLEGHLERLKHLQKQAQSRYSRQASTTTTSDVRSSLATTARSILADVQTVLQSLDLPHTLQDLDANLVAHPPSPRRSARAPVARAQANREEEQTIAVPRHGVKRKPKKRRLHSAQKDTSTDEDTNDEDTEDMDTNSEDAASEIINNKDTIDEDTNDEDTNDEGTNDEDTNDEDTETPHNQQNNVKTNDIASNDQEKLGSATIPLETDQPDTYGVPTALDGTCQSLDLGSYTVPTLEKFVYLDKVQRTGMGHLYVSDFSLEAFDLDLSHVQNANSTTTELKCNKSSWSGPGVVTISSENGVPPNEPYSIFTNIPRAEYSDSQMEQIFEQYCTPNTSRGPHWYLIGSTEEVFGERYRNLDLLTPGPYMRQSLDDAIIEGVNTTYIYASYSQEQTATAMHYEDCQWGSVNLVLSGAPKLWLSIEPAYTKQFENRLKEIFPKMTTCSQRVRHLGALFAPSFLRKLDVRYNIKACYPGQLIFTTGATYHQVINTGPNIAAAVNFMDSKTSIYPPDYVFCSSARCSTVNSITAKHFRTIKRSPPEEMTSATCKKSRQSITTHDLSQLQHLSLGLGEYLFPGLLPKSPAAILASILSKQAVIRLARLLSAQRLDHHHRFYSFTNQTHSSSFARRAAAYHRVTRVSLQDAELCLLRGRVNAFAYAHLLEQKKGDAERLDSTEISKILAEQKIEDTLKSRQTFKHDFSTRRKWLPLCRILGPGLLALLPLQSGSPYHLSASTFTKITEANIREFDHLVTEFIRIPKHKETLQRLCATADGLVRRIIQDTHFQFGLMESSHIEADFEYHCEWVDGTIRQPPENGDLDLEDMLISLTPRPYLIQSEPAQELYHASQHSATNPTLRPDVSLACSQAKGKCACLHPLRFNLCRISFRSLDTLILSCVDFSAGDLIGELTGLLHETEHQDCSGMFCALSWPGQADSRIHLHWDTSGNWVRRVRHSCNPNAAFAVQVIGCRLRVILEAKTAIATNSEMTADWSILPGQVESRLQRCVQCEGPCSSLAQEIGSCDDDGGTC